MKQFLKDFLEEYAEKFSYTSEIAGENEEIGLIVTQYGKIGFTVSEDSQLSLRKVEPLDDDNDEQISALIKVKKHFTSALKKAVESNRSEEDEEEDSEETIEAPKKKPASEKKAAEPPAKKPTTKKKAEDPEDAPVDPDPATSEDDGEEDPDVDNLGRKCPELPNKPPAHFTKEEKAPKKNGKIAEPELEKHSIPKAEDIPGTKAYGDKMRAAETAKATSKPKPASAPAASTPQTEAAANPSELVIADAAREMAYIKLLISSPAGGGKTMGSLLMAYGLTGDWGKILIIDTENKSGSLYVGSKVEDVKIGKYKTIQLAAPYTVERYLQAIGMAEKAGIKCLIIDSLSHAWTAEGGLLDLHTKLTAASRSGNSYTAWKDVTPLHAKLIEKIMNCNMHVIIAARSKTEYVLTQGEKGGMTPKKVGMGIVFRDGIEYEVSIALEVDQASHVAQVTKDRTTIFQDTPFFKITPEHGQQIMEWLKSNSEE